MSEPAILNLSVTVSDMEEVRAVIDRAAEEIAELRAENDRLRAELAAKIPDGIVPVPKSFIDFVRRVKGQIPEKPDYWSSCSQCESNSNDADDLVDELESMGKQS